MSIARGAYYTDARARRFVAPAVPCAARARTPRCRRICASGSAGDGVTSTEADERLALSTSPRAALSAAKRIVVKVGSRAIMQDGRFQALADEIALLMKRGHTI